MIGKLDCVPRAANIQSDHGRPGIWQVVRQQPGVTLRDMEHDRAGLEAG